MNRRANEGWRGKLIHVSGFIDFLSPTIQDLVGPADLIIFQRNIISEIAYDSLNYWRGMGKPVVVDLDDAYQMLPWSNPAHRFWNERDNGQAIRQLEEGLRLSDGLIAPNRLLLNDWAYVSGNSYYLQNYAEPGWWDNLPPRQLLKEHRGWQDRIVIGWGGSVSHYDSWWGNGIREAAKRVSDRHPELLWMICGSDRRIMEQLPISPRQKAHQPGVPPEKWPEIVKHFDIGIAPLHGPYDQRRSWIKGLEYNLAGAPWVGTLGEPYRDIADTGQLITNSVDNWEQALEDLIQNLEERQAVQESRQVEYQERFIVDHQIERFSEVYSQVIGDFSDNQKGLPGVYYVTKENEKPLEYRQREAI